MKRTLVGHEDTRIETVVYRGTGHRERGAGSGGKEQRREGKLAVEMAEQWPEYSRADQAPAVTTRRIHSGLPSTGNEDPS